MELTTKPDWQQAEARMQAWWEGEILDRPALLVKSPRSGMSRAEWDALQSPDHVQADQVVDWFTNVEQVVARGNRLVDNTFWGGEAFPVVFPVATRMVAITAAYLGCPYSLDPVSRTGWAAPIIDDWDKRSPIAYDPHNHWWQLSRDLLDAAAQAAPARYYVGMPDLNAPGEIVALLRDTQRLAFDLIDNPDPILPAIEEANLAWYRFWQAANGVVHQWIDGYFFWMGLWSDSRSRGPAVRFQRTDLATDVRRPFPARPGAADSLGRAHHLPPRRSRRDLPSRRVALTAPAQRHPMGARRRQASDAQMATAVAPHPGAREIARLVLPAMGSRNSDSRFGTGRTAAQHDLRQRRRGQRLAQAGSPMDQTARVGTELTI